MKHLTFLSLFLMMAVSSFGQAPTTNATDPEARDAVDVISIFSGVYTDVVGTNFNPNWGQSGFASANTSYDPGTGNLILAYPNFNYQGNILGSVQDISSMEFLHVDIWVNGTFDPKVVVISAGAEIPITITNTGAASWISADIPIEGITNDPTIVKELKFDGGSGSDSIYVDNIYFWKTPTTPQNDATLSDLKVDGGTITDFSASTASYTFGLPSGTTTIPQITDATTTAPNATTTITQASAIPGDATVVVLSEDETRTKTYTVSFAITSPGIAAPAPPIRNAADVISIFSDAYTDIVIETFSSDNDDSDITEVLIDGNATKRIDFTNYLEVSFIENRQDASTMTHFHMDFWFSSSEMIGKVFNSKFVDFGGGSSEASAMELNINGGSNPPLVSGTWVSIDVPLDSWVNNPSLRSDLAQFVLTSNLDIVYVDNIYLYKGEAGNGGGGTNEPTFKPQTAAPTPPVRNAADVISLFSDAYTSITLDTLSADFDDSVVEVVMIDGNSTLEIDFTNYLAIDFQSNKQDASAMTHFHMDFWTSSQDLVGKVFNSKFVDFGGGSSEASALELNINGGSNPPLVSGTWVSIDVPLDSWVNNPSLRSDLAQFLITSNLDTAYVDNIYLYDAVGTNNEVRESPTKFSLNQNYPNPFNPSTNISFSLPVNGDVTLEVFNIQGQKVATLVDGFKSAGAHVATFDASSLASGVYMYRLSSGSNVQMKKMLLIK